MHLTKSIPISAIFAISCASCPAPLGSLKIGVFCLIKLFSKSFITFELQAVSIISLVIFIEYTIFLLSVTSFIIFSIFFIVSINILFFIALISIVNSVSPGITFTAPGITDIFPKVKTISPSSSASFVLLYIISAITATASFLIFIGIVPECPACPFIFIKYLLQD